MNTSVPAADTANLPAASVFPDPVGPSKISARGVSVFYGQKRAIDDVSIEIPQNYVTAFIGPSGCGKSTFLRSLNRMNDTIANARVDGEILLDGVDITRMPMYRRAILGLGYLPQETSIFRGMTVEQNILTVLELVEPDKATRAAELDRLLDEFGLTRLRASPAMALSGGERRRCEIARALAANPSIILLDEPFAGIDPLSISDIRHLVIDLKNRGIGVLITDHNVRETLDIVDRACIIYGGQVLFAGSPEALVADPNVRRLYLGEGFTL